MNKRIWPVLFNIVWFQICWFACVVLGNKPAAVIVAVIVISYLLVERLRMEWSLLSAVFVLGFAVDTTLIRTGVLVSSPTLVMPPFWLSVLWLAFATTLNHSLKPLMEKPALFILLALIGGPSCYMLGVELSSLQFGIREVFSLSILAVAWVITGFFILLIYRKWSFHVAA